MQIKAPKDFWAGLMFVGFGAGFVYVAQDYAMGTAVRMGPAYFPTILGSLLALIGLVLVFRGFTVGGTPVPRFYFQPNLVIVVAISLFAVLLRPFGLVAATLALVIVSSFAGLGFSIKRVVPLAIGLAAFSALVFHYGLGLSLRLWPWS